MIGFHKANISYGTFSYFFSHAYQPCYIQNYMSCDENAQQDARPVMNITHQGQWHNNSRQSEDMHECCEFEETCNETDNEYDRRKSEAPIDAAQNRYDTG